MVLNSNKPNFLPKELFTKITLFNLSAYCTGHFIVDAICAGIIFSLFAANQSVTDLAFFIVLYNVLAFGLQLPLGYLSDKLMHPKYFAIMGLLLTAIGGIVALFSPLTGIVLAGFGNALFHIGGGSISLNLTPNKASAPGIYVAPGAIGLLVGTLLGKAGLFNPLIFSIIAFVLILIILSIKQPKINYDTKRIKKVNYLELIVLLLLLAIVSRSIIGLAISFPWKTDLLLLVVLTLGVFFGKAFGGILGDKFGWIKTGVGGLLLSAPLILFGIQNPLLGIIGIFLFNFTMPITLTASSNVFPGRPGFSFGLTCMALLIGVMPFFLEAKNIFANELLVFAIIIASAIAIFIALILSANPKRKLNLLNPKN